MTSTLPIDKINVARSTQPRALLATQVVEDYALAMSEGAKFPPVTVFFDGQAYWLADGFHRIAAVGRAAVLLGHDDVAQIECEVRQGSKRDAELFSLGANADHGLQRSDADKRRAIMIMLSDSEWGSWSDRNIARQCKVHHTTVARVRADAAAFFRGESRDEGGKYRPGRAVVYDSGMVDEIATGHVASDSRTYLTKHGMPGTMNTANIGKVKPSDQTQADHDQKRDEMRAALPEAVKQLQAHKASGLASPSPHQDSAELDELREANAALTVDVERLSTEVAKFEGMRVQFEQGGFEKVIAGKDEEIRILKIQVETESRDKAGWKKSADYWKAEAQKLGWSDPDVIPLGGRSNE